jgi:hypothetical protein
MKVPHILSLGALALGLALTACQDSGPVAPSDVQASRTETINGVRLLTAPQGLQLAGTTTKTIGLLGGTIEMDGGRLSVPLGALLLPRQITMTGMMEGHYQYHFGPDGLQFLLPATLTIAADPAQLGIPPEQLAVAVASDQGNDWQVLGGVYNPVTHTISVQVHHFSQYALCQN